MGPFLIFGVGALTGGTVGLLLGGMLAASKVNRLYERVERTEAANALQTRLLDELSQALRLLLDSAGTSTESDVSPQARKVLERLALAAELRAHLDDPLPRPGP